MIRDFRIRGHSYPKNTFFWRISVRRIPLWAPYFGSLHIVNIQTEFLEAYTAALSSRPEGRAHPAPPGTLNASSHVKVLSVPKSSFLQISCCLSLNKRHELEILGLQRWHGSLMWKRPEPQTQAGERKRVMNPACPSSQRVCNRFLHPECLSPAAAEHCRLLRMFQVWCLDPFLL